jgi:hypothetical protein
MDYQFWWSLSATILGVVLTGASAYYQKKAVELMLQTMSKKKQQEFAMSKRSLRWPIVVMVLIATSSWIPYLISDHKPSIGEVHMFYWGTGASSDKSIPIDQLAALSVGINTADLSQLARKKYRIAAVAFLPSGYIDYDDEANLQKSFLHDIPDKQLDIPIPLGDDYRALFKQGRRSTLYDALLVPKDITMDKFTTLRQAKSMGVIVAAAMGGPP